MPILHPRRPCEFAAAQAAKKGKSHDFILCSQFAAAQAAKKTLASVQGIQEAFAAAQAAKK